MAAITKIALVGATRWKTGAAFSWLVSEVIPCKTGVSIWIKVVPLRPVPLVWAPAGFCCESASTGSVFS